MSENSAPSDPLLHAEERLERGEVIYFPKAPFPLPAGDDHAFLLRQQLGGPVHKNISYDPAAGRVGGFARHGAEESERLRQLFADFSRTTTEWLARTLPRYAAGWQLDRISYRPEEEATRRLRHLARNDLLHVDAFPGRPSQGRRILRVFANVNPAEPRIWVTSSPFAALLEQYGEAAGLPGRTGDGLVRATPRGRRPALPTRQGEALRLRRLHASLPRLPEAATRGSRSAARSGCGRSRPAPPGSRSPTRAAIASCAAATPWNIPTSSRRTSWPCRTNRRPLC